MDGTSDSQTLSNKTLDNTNNISGDAITSGTVDKAWIDDEIARDSELPTVVTDHGDLTGRGDDDHAQYLLVSGARAMSGNLVMDDTTCNTNSGHNCYVDGVDVSAIGDVFPDTSGDSDTDGDGDVDLDDRYVNVSRDTMVGDLTMSNANIVMSDGYTVDGVDVSEMVTDIAPSSAGAFAYGTMNGSNVANAYNMSPTVTTSGGTVTCTAYSAEVGNFMYVLSFETPRDPGDTNYSVTVTPTGNVSGIIGARVVSKTENGFSVRLLRFSPGPPTCMLATSGTFDFVVFSQ